MSYKMESYMKNYIKLSIFMLLLAPINNAWGMKGERPLEANNVQHPFDTEENYRKLQKIYVLIILNGYENKKSQAKKKSKLLALILNGENISLLRIHQSQVLKT
jgi:hypothetical protein